jgi:hypothetical protein
MSILDNLIAAIRPQSEPTPEPAIPQEAPATMTVQTQPLSDFAIAARRLIARAEALTPVAAAPRTGRSNWPIEIIQLEVHVQRLLLETQVVGDVEAKAEAAATPRAPKPTTRVASKRGPRKPAKPAKPKK